jgi:uncharacterized membrane protein YadS
MPMSPARYGLLQLRQWLVFHPLIAAFAVLAPVAVGLCAGSVVAAVAHVMAAVANWRSSHG